MPATLSTPTHVSSSLTHLTPVVVVPTQGSAHRAARSHQRIARVLLGGLALPIVAWRGHLEAAVQHLSWLLTGLMLLQGLLIDLGHVVPVISALHPVNAMLLVLVTYSLARRAV